MKYIVYYALKPGGKVNRSYPEYVSTVASVKSAWLLDNQGTGRIYLQHEEFDEYQKDWIAAGMMGADDATQRAWLDARVHDLQVKAQAKATAGLLPPRADTYGGAKPGDIVRDQHGRSGRVPQVPLEVFRNKPIKPDDAMDAVRDFCKGGGGTIPKGS